MSRPSTTMPFSVPTASERCSSVIRVRTSGTALTALTLEVTSWVRIGPATSTPSTVMSPGRLRTGGPPGFFSPEVGAGEM
ncbi:hypothetical protein GCM10017687_11290 [Streptomyces echinatus]